MTVTELPVLLKPAEAAELLRTTVKSLGQDRFHNRGAPFVRIGSRILYDRDALLEYIRAGAVTPAHPLASRRLRD
jgi:hypothetical protein